MNDKSAAGQDVPSIELLECPFCGGAAEAKHIGNEWGKKQVCEISCTTFGCFAHQRVGFLNGRGHDYEWAKRKCLERWNKRHSNDHDHRSEGAKGV